MQASAPMFVHQVFEDPAELIMHEVAIGRAATVKDVIVVVVVTCVEVGRRERTRILVGRFVSPEPRRAQYLVTLRHLVVIVGRAITVLICRARIAQFTAVLEDFFFLSRLPRTSRLVVPSLVQVVTGGPPILQIVFFLLTSRVTVFVRGVLRITMRTFRLTAIREGAAKENPHRIIHASGVAIR